MKPLLILFMVISVFDVFCFQIDFVFCRFCELQYCARSRSCGWLHMSWWVWRILSTSIQVKLVIHKMMTNRKNLISVVTNIGPVKMGRKPSWGNVAMVLHLLTQIKSSNLRFVKNISLWSVGTGQSWSPPSPHQTVPGSTEHSLIQKIVDTSGSVGMEQEPGWCNFCSVL